MDSFWTAPANLPFLIALGLFFGLSLLQGISFLMGLSLDQSVDQWVDAPDVDVDADVDMDLDLDGVTLRHPHPHWSGAPWTGSMQDASHCFFWFYCF